MILVFTTFNDKQVAKKMGKGLLEKRLIACYNLFPIESGYRWKGKIVEDNEFLMIMKANDEDFPEIEEYIKANHNYDVPEIVSIKADKVSKDYLDWLISETKV